MKTVWVLTIETYDYEAEQVRGVFSTKEKAYEAKKELRKQGVFPINIYTESFTVDQLVVED